MTTSHSVESTITRKIVWTGVVLLAATVAACGGVTQTATGTAPSEVASIAAATENGGSFSLLKEGKGKGHSPAPDLGTPTTGDTPEGDDPEGDGDELGTGHGHGKAAIQLEGLATIDAEADCPALIITINGLTVTTNGVTVPVLSNPDEYIVSGAAPNLTDLMTRTTFAGATFPLLTSECMQRLYDATPEEFGPLYLQGVTPECFDEAELRSWIRNAPAMKPMYASPTENVDGKYRGMPELNLTENQIDELVAYLQTRK